MSIETDLSRVVDGRRIGLLCSGKSIEELHGRIHKECYDNICWVGVNSVQNMSNVIAPRRIDIFCILNPRRFEQVRYFVDHNHDTLLISQNGGFNPQLDERFNWMKNAHTGMFTVKMLNILGYKDIYLFGADGGGEYYNNSCRNTPKELVDIWEEDHEFVDNNELCCTNVNENNNYSIPSITYDKFEEGA